MMRLALITPMSEYIENKLKDRLDELVTSIDCY